MQATRDIVENHIKAALDAQAALAAAGINVDQLGDLIALRDIVGKIALPSQRLLTPKFEKLHGGDIVLDHSTGLEWDARKPTREMTHEEAKAFCADLDLHGGGWLLPSRVALLTLVDDTRYAPATDTEAFPDTPNGVFWTDTKYAGDSDCVWGVNFDGGYSSDWDRHYSFFVRACRPRQ